MPSLRKFCASDGCAMKNCQPIQIQPANKLLELIKKVKLLLEQVYNKTGLNFKRLPVKRFAASNEKSAAGFKINTKRITIVVCCKNVNASLICYKNQRSTCMDAYVFKD